MSIRNLLDGHTIGEHTYIDNITCLRVDMNFIFEHSTWYLTSEISSWTWEDKIHIHKLACNILFMYSVCMYMYVYVYYINILITMFLTTFRRFPTTFRRFPKIFQNCAEGLTNGPEHCRKWPKIAEGSQRFPRRYQWCFDHTTPPLSTFKRLCSYSNVNLKTCDNNLIFLHVKISYFYMWKYMDFLSGRNPNKTLDRC